MDLTWNLESLYSSWDSEECKRDQARLYSTLNDLKEWTEKSKDGEAPTLAMLESFLRRYNAFLSVHTCLSGYAELVLSTDSGNIEAINLMDETEATQNTAKGVLACFSSWLAKLEDLERIIDSSAYIAEHRFYLLELRRQSAYMLSEETELAIGSMRNTGSRAWERMYMQTVSTLSAEAILPNGVTTVSLAELRNMAYDPRAGVRKAAYEAEQQAYREIAQLSAACLNAISGEAVTICGLRGYTSPLDKVLMGSRMDRETLDTMLSAIRESLPVFHSYLRKKAGLLGYGRSLPFYELFAPLGEGGTKLSYTEAAEGIISGFETFSGELAAFAHKVFELRWIDAEPRPGKGNYGLCVDIAPLGESRIMTQFNGLYTDMVVLAHEIGHAYHSSCLAGSTMVNTEYPTPIAETASIFCETIINHELLKSTPAEARLSILEKSISDASYYIVDFYARYLFESRLYERRCSGVLSVTELNELMLACLREAYGDGIDPATLHPYMWISRAGYYMAGNEFLNFPYSLGLLFSKGLYAQYQQRGEPFVAAYRSFLAATGTRSIAGAAQMMGIDVRSPQFWRSALALIGGEIEQFVR